jgi:hypothetical protein
MNLDEALAHAETLYERGEQEYTSLVAQAEAKQAELDDLRVEIDGLKRAIARHERRSGGTQETKLLDAEQARPARGQWPDLPRTKAVYSMMVQAGKPVSPRELSQMLQAVGRDDTPDVVGRALYHLQRRKRARSVGRAQWVPAEQVPAGSTNGAVPNRAQGEEVSDDQEMSRVLPTFTGGEQRS